MMMRFGTTDFAQVFDKAPEATAAVLTGITMLLFLGATGKSAQIPLFTWLPDAMAGPTPVSALIHAATMVTAGIYMITRSHVLFDLAPITQNVIAIIGLATALLAATIALRQNDIKKVLAYSTVSQLGYMFLALGVGAYTGAIFHVMTHAFFKALLFLGAGSVIHALHHEQDLRNMGGLSKKMPITHITFLIACLAIAGIPPFSGFFSKDEILTAALLKNPVFYVLGVAGALMTSFYMFRLYAMAFRGEFRGTEAQASHLHESPSAMTIPLIILAVLSVAGGWVGIPEVLMHDAHKLQAFLAPVLEGIDGAAETGHHLSHSTELMLMGGVLVLIIGVITFAWKKYSTYNRSEEVASSGVARFLENKWYVDELYEAVISKPLKSLSAFMNLRIERQVIDGVVNGVGKAVQYGSRQLRLIQSGQVGSYILIMVIFLILFFVLQLFWNLQ
jgi:NADH-quinone oxidoreductase subunit L